MVILQFMSENSMYFYIAFMLLGVLLGYYGKIPEFLKEHNGKLQSWCLYVLLVAIGMELGSNSNVLKSLGGLGLKAAVISLLSVIGTVCCINIAARMINRERVKGS